MIVVRPREAAANMRWLQIDATSVSYARDFVDRVLRDAGVRDAEHADDVRTVVSELTTNAIKYGTKYGDNIVVEVGIWPRWSLISVDDRDPVVYERVVSDDDFASLGVGLAIVRDLSERFWWNQQTYSKTANAIVLRPGVTLRRRDLAVLRRLEDSR